MTNASKPTTTVHATWWGVKQATVHERVGEIGKHIKAYLQSGNFATLHQMNELKRTLKGIEAQLYGVEATSDSVKDGNLYTRSNGSWEDDTYYSRIPYQYKKLMLKGLESHIARIRKHKKNIEKQLAIISEPFYAGLYLQLYANGFRSSSTTTRNAVKYYLENYFNL